MARNEIGGSKENLDRIVVGLKHAAEDLAESHKDRLQLVQLSFFREAGEGDLGKIPFIVLGRGTAAFVCLLRHCNMTAEELGLDRILKSIGYHIRSESSGRNDNSLFELEREMNTESVRGSTPRSIDPHINSNLNRRNCSQPVESLL